MNKLIKSQQEIETTVTDNNLRYISLDDLTHKAGTAKVIIQSWLKMRETIEFLGNWEGLHNPEFLPEKAREIFKNTGTDNFSLTVSKWIKQTSATGLLRKKVKGKTQTFAHPDIALDFAAFLSPAFRIYLFKEFQRLKKEEAEEATHKLQWTVRRELSKINYRRHAEAVRKLVPPKIDELGKKSTLASEADLLNIALFGINARQWRKENPDKEGNIRDHASLEQLTVLANLENLNAYLIEHGFEQDERLQMLNREAIKQMEMLLSYDSVKELRKMEEDGDTPLLPE